MSELLFQRRGIAVETREKGERERERKREGERERERKHTLLHNAQ